MRRVTAAEARAAIAHAILGAPPQTASLGAVTLHPHQLDAAARLGVLLDAHGGALLADQVGLGKTYSALAVARHHRTLIVAPSALRQAWADACARAAVEAEFLSVEALSRRRSPRAPPALVVIDEAHHLRNPATTRFAQARAVCRDARVLLLSATPLQNRETDLRALLSLFLGTRAFALPTAALSSYVVRRTATDLGGLSIRLPGVAPPEWLAPVEDADCLGRILALPPPLPARDGAVAQALIAYTLARQWSSSRAALLGAVRRRRARGLALMDSLDAGAYPTRSELSAWTFVDGAQQLALPALLGAGESRGAAALRRQAERHVDALASLAAWLAVQPDPDVARASRLRALLARHPGRRIVAFSEFTDTVRTLYRLLVPHARVAMLSHRGGHVAGGPVTRAEVIDRFLPGSRARFPDRERIDLLLTTDVLSEGVGLHDAGIVVHLDLAWNPARLEQRVGRLRRLGASHDSIGVFLMPPPLGADSLLRLEERLREKLARAARALGASPQVLPATPAAPLPSPWGPEMTRLLMEWARSAAPEEPVIAAVRGPGPAALAVIRESGSPTLWAFDGERFSDEPEFVARILARALGDDADDATVAMDVALARFRQFVGQRAVSCAIESPTLQVAQSRRRLLRRLDGISERAGRHAQPALAPLLHAARAAASSTLTAGAELLLDELSAAALDDAAWLQAVGQFVEGHARSPGGAARIDALLVVVP